MTNTLSRKQIQKMRRLTNAKFPMLGVVAVATLFVVRVPIIQSWEAHADTSKVQLGKRVDTTDSDKPEPPEVDQVSTATADSPAEPGTTASDAEANQQQDITENHNWFDLLTQFQPRKQNDAFSQNESSQKPNVDSESSDDLQVELQDMDLRHVSQSGPDADASEHGEQVLRLHNPPENGGMVYFVVDEDTYSIDVGQMLELTGEDQWLVMFHRGGNFGNSHRVVKPGSYSFSVGKRGWSLNSD